MKKLLMFLIWTILGSFLISCEKNEQINDNYIRLTAEDIYIERYECGDISGFYQNFFYG